MLLNRGQRLAVLSIACLAALAIASPPAGADPVPPPNFEDTQIATVVRPIGLAFTPDGRMLITDQYGRLFVYKNGGLLPTPALDFRSRICSDNERGLAGIAVDPAFATNHYIYVYYTFDKYPSSFPRCVVSETQPPGLQTPVNRVSRFTLGDNDIVAPASEVVLIDNIPQPSGHHIAGDLHFGKDSYLYVTSGDGGCDYAGNSGCYELNDAAQDPSALVGKILRITRDGDIPPGNPYQGVNTARCNLTGTTTTPNKCQEIYAQGLRNPFRFAFDPNATSTRFYINDTGQNTWEEVDLGQSAANYGWNTREGPCDRGLLTGCTPTPIGMTDPVYAYNHNPPTDGTPCTAITGGAFVPLGIWPQQYDGAYLYQDLVCGKIFALTPATGGGFTKSELVTGVDPAISMAFGPYGSGQALYYITWRNDPNHQIRRLAYTGQANRPPVARAMANPDYGPLPLTVDFDGTASNDPDDDPLTYDWDFGDGTLHSSSPTPSHTYTSAATRTATLTVSDSRGGENSTSVRIDAGNTPPTPTIEAPAPSYLFRVGEQITLTGGATDAEDGPLPDSALSWEVRRHHATHYHPFLPPTPGNDVSITTPGPEDLLAATNSYLEIRLTATDSTGRSTTISQNLDPRKVDLTFTTSPSGLTLQLAGDTITAPQTIVSWDSWDLPVNTSSQDTSDQSWAFQSWSDGGAAAHSIHTPSSPASYTASFIPYYHPVGTASFRVGLVPAFRPCETNLANSTHGAPLAIPSCNPPVPASSTVRVGTHSIGFLRMVVCPANSAGSFCNPSGGALPKPDVRFTGSIKDVKCAPSLPPGQATCSSPGADYNPNGAAGPYSDAGSGNGNAATPPCFPSVPSPSTCIAGSDLTEVAELPGAALGAVGTSFEGRGVRITDQYNGASGERAATVVDIGFPIPLDCITTTDATLGSTCGVNTTANALAPGTVLAGNQANWQIGEVEIRDSGPDGARGNSDDELFATQGVFLP